jgi:hypothetical protein
MNKKNIMLAIASAVLATGLAVSVLGSNAPVFAATSGSTQASSGGGTSGTTGFADANIAASAGTGGPSTTLCLLAQGCASN